MPFPACPLRISRRRNMSSRKCKCFNCPFIMGFLAIYLLMAASFATDAAAFWSSEGHAKSGNQPPTVTLLNPTNGQVFNSTDQILVEADAADPDGTIGSVQFFVNDAPAGQPITKRPFRTTLKSLPTGSYTIKAVSRDEKTLTSEPAYVKLVIVSKQETASPPVPAPPPPAPVAGSVPKEKDEVILRLHGSNTIGAKLAPALAEEFLKLEGFREIDKIAGSNHEEIAIRGKLEKNGPGKIIEIHSHGSSTAFKDMLAGKCDIGLASRRIKDDEVNKMREKSLGDMTSPSAEHVLALDGIAVIVHGSNPIKTLSVERIAAIFAGDITDWSELNGPVGRIQIYARDDKSGTFDTFQSLVLKDRKLAGSAQRFEDSNLLSDKVAADPNGIGFIGLPYIRSARALAIQTPGADPILPTTFTVAREDYPLSRRLFLYTSEFPRNPQTSRFVEFALSKAGQQIAREIGFIDQIIQPEKNVKRAAAASNDLETGKYIRLTKDALQLSANFRFRTASDQLDNKSMKDLDRLIQLLSQPDHRDKGLLLFGFTDSRGNEQTNLSLSRSRALLVSAELRARGVPVKVAEGFGSKNPVSSNDTEDGRERNRRVEVWIER
jgi:phosphate transport system substrate-binding protein